MKIKEMKILVFFIAFIFCDLISMAQTFPVTAPNQGNPSTLTPFPGAVSSAYKLRQFADTATANTQLYLKFTPHLMIKVGNNVYVRNTAATQWILVGGNFILNPGVDSVTLYGNNLCQWVSGVPTCYALNNSSFSNYAVRGDFIYDSLLYFHSTAYQYYILGRYFTAPYTSHLLTPPNPSAARNDAAYVDTLSSAGIITGVNGGGVPSTNPVSQFKIGEIHINAADTVPSNFSNEIAYRFDNEWSPTSAISGFTSAYATAPFTGTSVSMYVPSFVDGETISLLNDTLLDISNASYLKVRVWLGASFTAANLNFSFNSLGNVASTSVPLLNGQFGYTSTVVGSWQEINIPMAYFQLFSYSIDEIVIGTTGANASGFKIGNVVIQFGGLPTSSAVGGIQSVNANFGPHVILPITDTGYVDSDTSNYVYKDKRTNTVLFTLPTYLKNLNSTRTAADTCIVLDTLGKTIFISFNQNCGGSGGGIDTIYTNAPDNYFSYVKNGNTYTVDLPTPTGVQSVTGTGGISVDNSDPVNPIVDGSALQLWKLSGGGNIYYDEGKVTVGTPSGTNDTLNVGGTIDIDNGFAYKMGNENLARSDISRLNYFFGPSGNLTMTGGYNITIGHASFLSNTTGGSNIAIGDSSLALNTTGGENTAIGVFSMPNNTTGFNNTAIGHFASNLNTLGIGNTAVGAEALRSNSTGNYNTVVGAGSSTGITTGNYNTIIGAGVVGLSGNLNNNIILSDGQGNKQFTIDSLGKGKLRTYGIGTHTGTPTYNLQVDATGNIIEGATGGGITTASNGLTLTGSDVTLGGTLTGNTTIDNNGFSFTMSRTGTAGNYTSIFNSTGGSSVRAVTTDGFALDARADGTGVPLIIRSVPSSTNTVVPIATFQRQTSSTAANGIGGSIDIWLESSTGGIDVANSLISKYTNATTATRTSQFILTGVNNAVTSDWLTLDGVYGLLGTDTISTRAYARSVGGGSVVWGGIGGTLSDQTDLNTALGLKAPLASPTFTGTVTIPTPFTLGATSVTSTGTQLNYINAATGTTGTTSTNLVFSTSPTFITPVLGAATATSVTHTQTASAANTVVESFIANNTTTASSGNQMYGGFFHSGGQGWKTTATAASQAVDYRHGLVPIQGAANPIANYVFESSINGGAYARNLAVRSDGQIGVGGNTTLATDATYSTITANSDFSTQITLTSSITQATVKSFFLGDMILSGAGAFTAVRGINSTITNNSSSVSNIIRAGYFSARNSNAGSRANTLIGVDAGAFPDNSTGGTIAIVSAVDASFLINAAGPTITNAYGLRVKDLGTNSGTFTNTYGVHVGDITLGTQTNTPFSFYASDANALNYFAGATGIGVTAPTAYLHLKAGTATASTAPEKYTAGTLNTVIEALTQEANASSRYESTVALNRYAKGGVIADFTADVNNSGTSETDLLTYTTKASSLTATGEKLIFEASGTLNDLTATAQLQFYFGGTNIGNTGALTVSATGGWFAKILVIRTGASTARAVVTLSTPGASTAQYTTETDITGLTFTNTNIIKITGTAGGASGGSSDITAKLGTIFWWGSANN